MARYACLPPQRVVFGQPAAASMKCRWVLVHPQPIGSEADVMRLLEAAW